MFSKPVFSAMVLTTLVSLSPVLAGKKGFNYSNRYPSKAGETTVRFKVKDDYIREFTAAQTLAGASGFTSARLFVMTQGETDAYIEAIPAAIETNTRLLLGVWASADTPANRDKLVTQQITALSNAIKEHGTAFTALIDGVSVGSEDIYRNTERGRASGAGPGADALELVPYVNQLRTALAQHPDELAPYPNIKITHVDTKGVWTDGQSKNIAELIDAVDVIGLDQYPYYQNDTGVDNSIQSALSVFKSDLDMVMAVANTRHKGVWITETGWPHAGPAYGPAIASVDNAHRYWKEVGCWLWTQGVDVWWYIMQDEATEAPGVPEIAFGILPASPAAQALPQTPLFDLSCPAPAAKRLKRF